MTITSGGPEHIYESEISNGEITAAIGPREEIIRCRDCRHRPPTIEQRCQQLEQVARDMWISLISTDDLFIQDRASRHREQLEALGVDVDG